MFYLFVFFNTISSVFSFQVISLLVDWEYSLTNLKYANMPQCLKLLHLFSTVDMWWYVMLSKNIAPFQEQCKKCCASVTGLRGELVQTPSSLHDFEKFYKTSVSQPSGLSWMWMIWGRQRYHPSATSPGPNGLLQTGMFDCVWCVHTTYPPTPFMSKYQRAAACTGSQMDFLIQLFARRSFNPLVLKPKPKMYLNTSIPLDPCLPFTPWLSLCVLTGWNISVAETKRWRQGRKRTPGKLK